MRAELFKKFLLVSILILVFIFFFWYSQIYQTKQISIQNKEPSERAAGQEEKINKNIKSIELEKPPFIE